MKKNIIKSIIALVFVVGAIVSFNVEMEAHEPIYDTQCYNNTSNCWFWFCHTVTHCGNCAPISADEWYEPERCARNYN